MFIAALCLIATGAGAQDLLKSVNGAVRYNIDKNSYNQLGFEAGVTLGIADRLEFVPAISYFVKNKGIRSWELDADLHYNLFLGRSHKMACYPIAGIAYKVWSQKIKTDDFDRISCNKLGFNVGAGASYDITSEWAVRLEGKYQWFNHKFDRGCLGIGVSYKF